MTIHLEWSQHTVTEFLFIRQPLSIMCDFLKLLCRRYSLARLPDIKRSTSAQAILVLAAMFSTLFSLAGSSASFKSGRWGLETNYQAGAIIKHNKKIKEVPATMVHGFEVNYFQKSLGEKPWMKPLNFPEYGVSFNYFSLGNREVFGDAYAIMGFAKFFLVRSRVANFYTRMGGGFSYLTKPYNYLTNPRNNIVSTHLNIAVQLRIGLDWKLHNQVQLGTAVTFSHFSNAASKKPNFGINIVAASVGLRFFPVLNDVSYNCTQLKPHKKNELIAKYSMGLQETYGFNGPTYFAQVGTLLYGRYTSYGNKLLAGLSLEYLPSIKNFFIYNELASKNEAQQRSFITSIILGDEILLGRFGMFYMAGIYLWKSPIAEMPVYFKVGGNYYYAQFGKDNRFKLFVGTNVKSHLSVAQYWEFSTGACF